MANILYIHGFGSDENSGTFLGLKKAFPDENFISSTFELLDVQKTLDKIKLLCDENKIDIIIGKSLGAFYTLAFEGEQNKIVINPCIKPWIEIPKLDSSVAPSLLENWKTLFDKTEKNIGSEQRIRTFGIFGNKDNLFSYKNYFDEKYDSSCASLEKSFFVPGEHHIEIEPLKIAVQKGFNYFKMMHSYDIVFSLMPFYQLVNDPEDNDYLNMQDEEKKKIVKAVESYHNMMLEYQKDKIFEELNPQS